MDDINEIFALLSPLERHKILGRTLLSPALVAELSSPWCPNQLLTPKDVVRRWFRPDGAQVGRFSSWGTVVPKGFLTKSAYFLSRT